MVGSCIICERSSPLISRTLGLCLGCIRREPSRALEHAAAVHAAVRGELDQVPAPPRSEGGIGCPLCARACRLADGETGFCGLRRARGARLQQLAGTPRQGLVHWYRDALPTNCVADFFCEGHRQRGRHNLAVFYGACTLSCLFCQNWSFRTLSPGRSSDLLSAEGLAAVANDRTHCICYFGGDPSAQLPHALATSRRLARRGVAICFETNGLGHPVLMRTAAELARASGGTVKLDLKACDPTLHRVLTSADNARVLENLRALAPLLVADDGPPRLCAATLLVPGYVDVQEVEGLARILAEIDPGIPYSLLAFHPQFAMTDLPQTSWAHAEAAERAARAAGLAQVRVGNIHLLSRGYGVDAPW